MRIIFFNGLKCVLARKKKRKKKRMCLIFCQDTSINMHIGRKKVMLKSKNFCRANGCCLKVLWQRL